MSSPHCPRWMAVLLVLVGTPVWAADPAVEAQKKYLKEFQGQLAKRPINPVAAAAHVREVQETLQKALSTDTKPSLEPVNNLAAILLTAVDRGQMSVDQSVQLAKELGKVLREPAITDGQTRAFVNTIDPLVQRSGLEATDRIRLYREALMVIKTTPAYAKVPR